MAATMHGHQDCVETLLGKTGVRVDAASSDGETALMLAVGEHDQSILTLLIRHKAVRHSRRPLELLPSFAIN